MKKKHLSIDEVKHLAKLSNLPLTAEEIEKFQGQLSETLDYIEILKKVNTNSIEDLSKTSAQENVLRNDEIRPSFPQIEALKNASRTYKGYFLTRAIFNET